MKKIILTKEDMRSFRLKKPLGQGANARVYRYNADLVIKIWKNKYPCVKDDFINNIKALEDYTHPSLIKTQALGLYNGEVISGFSSYAKGKSLRKLKDVSYEKLIKALKDFQESLIKISQDKVVLEDLALRNLIYEPNENKVQALDDDFWYKAKTKEEALTQNISYYNHALIYELFLNYYPYNYFIDLEDAFYLEQVDIINYLNKLKDILESFYDKQINTFKEYRQALNKGFIGKKRLR